MELSVNKKVWQYMLIMLFLMIVGVSFLFYIKPVFIAGVLAILVTIFIDKLIEMFKTYTKNWTPLNRKAAAVICVAGIVFIGSIFMIGVAVNVKNNFDDLLNVYNDLNAQYSDFTEEYNEGPDENITDNASNTTPITPVPMNQNDTAPPPNPGRTSGDLLREMSTNFVTTLLSNSGLMASTKGLLSLITSTAMAAALIIPLTAMYYFKEKGKIKQKFVSLAPDKYKPMFERTIQNVTNDIGTYTLLKIFEAVFISFLYCGSFYVIGLPHWFVFGLLMGICNIVSYIGFVLPAIPVTVYAYSVGSEMMIAVAGAIVVVQIFDFFFILPNMVMKTIKISPLTAVLLTLAGFKLFGIFGLVFALPIYMFCKIVLISCYKMLVVMYPDPVEGQDAAYED